MFPGVFGNEPGIPRIAADGSDVADPSTRGCLGFHSAGNGNFLLLVLLHPRTTLEFRHLGVVHFVLQPRSGERICRRYAADPSKPRDPGLPPGWPPGATFLRPYGAGKTSGKRLD